MANESKALAKSGSGGPARPSATTQRGTGSAPQPSGSGVANPKGATAACGETVNIGFYDISTHAPLLPDAAQLEAQVDFQTVEGVSLGQVTWNKSTINNCFSIALPSYPKADTEDKTESLETLCGAPETDDTDLVVLTCPNPILVNCQPYFVPGTAIAVPSAAARREPQAPTTATSSSANASSNEPVSSTTDRATACSILIPITRIEESYSVRFFAYDSCYKDYLLNAKAFVNQVEVTATPVKTRSSGSSTSTRAAMVTGRTSDGFVDLSGLTPNVLYRIEVSGPRDYVCVKPPESYLCNPTAKNVRLQALFQPCGKFPVRSVIFAQQGCPGLRLNRLNFQANGQSVSADENGIWNVPAGTTGIVDFQALGKTFSPASIDLNNDAAMVFLVGVADQTVGQLARPGEHRFFFVDEKGEPYKHRTLHLRSHNGEESTVSTGGDGGFNAEQGWVAWADEDESGHRVDEFPLLLAKV